MSGNYYEITHFYICNQCKSYDVISAIERNYNHPMCRDCGSKDLSPNQLFNTYKFETSTASLVYIDQHILSEEIKNRRKFLMELYGRNHREHNLNKIL